MRTTISMLALIFFTGCSGLQGDWDGEMTCGSDEWDAKFEIAKNEFDETTIEGGIVGAIPCGRDGEDTIDCNFMMSGIIYQSHPTGAQDLQIDMDSCQADGGIEGSIGWVCETENGQWDGGKALSFIHQRSGGQGCTVELERQ
jgi:hypothetical protein